VIDFQYLSAMKYKLKVALVLFVLCICFTGCSESFLESTDQETVIENNPQLDVEEARRAFALLPFETGENDFELPVLYNQKWIFRFIIPETTNDELLPLFLDLHGGARTPRNTIHQWINCSLRGAWGDTRAYILSPNSQGLLWYDEFNETQVVNLVKFAIENFNIDPNKVVVTGYSDGGNGSWFFADTHPELFSAAIPLASSYPLMTNEDGTLRKIDIPIYAIQGELETLFPYSNIESRVEQHRAAGSDIILVKAIGLDHNTFCSYTPYVEDALEWLETTVWD